MDHPTSAAERSPRETFDAFVRDFRVEVDARLVTVLDRAIEEASAHGPESGAMVSAVRDLTLRGGKRLRAAMAMAAYGACGGSGNESAVLDAGAALELLQSYFLIHDDWMDGDQIRRGGPSVHAMLRLRYGSQTKGDSAAILAGDYAVALAQQVLAAASAPADRVVAVLACFARIQRDAVLGQQLDNVGRTEDVEAMHALKTGSYTVRGPLEIGGRLAGASDAQLASLDAYAAPLGVAFQLRDDLLGTFGDTEETGKPFGNDLRAGKQTALLAEGQGRLDVAGRAAVAAVLGNAEASEGDIRTATTALAACGAQAAIEARVEVLVARSEAVLATAELSANGQTLLRGASRALTSRRA